MARSKGSSVLDIVDAALTIKPPVESDRDRVRISVTLDATTYWALKKVAQRIGMTHTSALNLLAMGAVHDAFAYIDSKLQRGESTIGEYMQELADYRDEMEDLQESLGDEELRPAVVDIRVEPGDELVPGVANEA